MGNAFFFFVTQRTKQGLKTHLLSTDISRKKEHFNTKTAGRISGRTLLNEVALPSVSQCPYFSHFWAN